MQIVFFSMKDQMPHPIEVDDELFSGDITENIRLIREGVVYKLVQTTNEEIEKINNLRTDFENREFDKLRQKFNFKSKDEVPKDFVKQFYAELDNEERKKQYADFYATIKEENKEQVYNALTNHFLTYIFMFNRYTSMVEENMKQRTDPSFFKDYCNRYRKVFTVDFFYNKKTIRQISEELDKLHKSMDIDERRHAGYDRVIKGVSSLGSTATNLVPKGDDAKDFLDTVINFTNEKYGSLFKQFDAVFRLMLDYYTKLPDTSKDNITAIRKLNPDPALAYLTALQKNVASFLNATDKYLKDASAAGTEDKDRVKLIRDEYINCIVKFYEALDYIYTAYDADDVKFEDENTTKQFEALWESSIFYKNSREGDWFLTFARLLYKSYDEFFKPVLAHPETKVPPKDTPDQQ